MRRIALLCPILAGLVVSFGCSSAEHEMRPLPDPVLSTRRYTPPPPPAPAPQPKPAPMRSTGIDTAGWTPPGGIEPGRWKTIVVHHSTSEKDTPAGMDAWHRQRGWQNGLGYHFVIGNGVGYPDGAVYVGPRWKRQIQGAHCATKSAGWYFGKYRPSNFFNDRGIGICLVGNMNNHPPTEKQREALAELVAWLRGKTGISNDLVYGHGHVTHATQCPGRYLTLSTLRQTISSIHASSE